MSVTAAVRFLRERGMPYEAREYLHREKGAEYAAQALSWPLGAMVKTLVAGLSDGSFVLCLLPGDVELSLKALARVAGVKSARMAGPGEAERLTGYLVGGISPFGTRKPLGVWMHAPLLDLPRVGINGGHRGLILFLSPADIRDALAAHIAPLDA